jgi:copper homeostasis protein
MGRAVASRRALTPQLEICIESAGAGLAARKGGADRLELCSALSVGGLTPSHGLIAQVVEECGLPVHVLLRPRAGGFVYSSREFRILERDLDDARALGAAGCVVGLLTSDGAVDVARTRALVQRAGSMEITFHRAFDHSRDLNESLEQVIEAGCGRLLSSGGRPTVGEGAMKLAELVRQAAGRLRIAAGGGVTIQSAAELLQRTAIDLHASLRKSGAARQAAKIDPLWEPETRDVVDPADVHALVELLSRVRA